MMKLRTIDLPWNHMFCGYRRMFWGILLMLFHINLGPIQVLPDFVGYMLIASGIGYLKNVADSHALCRASIVAKIMIVKSLLEFLLSFFGISLDIPLFITVFIMGAMSGLMLLLIYDILNVSAVILRLSGDSQLSADIDRRLHIYLVTDTLLSLASILMLIFSETEVLTVIMICGIILRLWLASIFARLKRRYNSTFFYGDEPL